MNLDWTAAARNAECKYILPYPRSFQKARGKTWILVESQRNRFIPRITITAQNHSPKSSTSRRNQITPRHIHHTPLQLPLCEAVTTSGTNREKQVHIPLSLPGMAYNDPTKRTDNRSKRILVAMSSWMPRNCFNGWVRSAESSRLKTRPHVIPFDRLASLMCARARTKSRDRRCWASSSQLENVARPRVLVNFSRIAGKSYGAPVIQ